MANNKGGFWLNHAGKIFLAFIAFILAAQFVVPQKPSSLAVQQATLAAPEPALPLDKKIENLHAAIKLFVSDPMGGMKDRGIKDIRVHTLLLYSFAGSVAELQEEVGKMTEGREEYLKAINATRADLAKLQTVMFPKLRHAYAKELDEAMWEHDMDVTAEGQGGIYLNLINAAFAANRNIKTVEDSLGEMIDFLRFRQTRYQWYKGSEYTYFTYKTPVDGEITIAKGGRLIPVPPIK